MSARFAGLSFFALIFTISAKTNASLTELLTIYDAGSIRDGLANSDFDITDRCVLDMDIFLQDLDEKRLWALKAYDASGRYSTGFFWGNNYWLGSETLCLNIHEAQRHFDPLRHSPAVSRNISIEEDDAPIALGFFKVRTLLTPPPRISPPRTILLGLCLPLSCIETDVRSLLNISISGNSVSSETNVVIQRVKTPHEYYIYWKDPVFWVLACVSCIMYFLLLIGTLCDYMIERRVKKATKAQYTNDSFNPQPEKLSAPATSLNLHRGKNGSKFDDNLNSVDLATSEHSSISSTSQRGVLTSILISFSVRRNLRAIWDRSVGDDTIPTVHGLRCMSMSWVIIGHTCIIIFKYSDNMEFRGLIEKEFFFQTISNAAFSVDSFFFISGLLVAFLYFRTTAKIDVSQITHSVGIKSNSIQFFGLILYRFCRLTAPYLFILGCVQVSMQYFQHNSVFDPPTDDHSNCPKYWWRNALYINTLFPVEQMCMLWSWYLADDTQFYILGLALLITAVTHLKVAAGLLLTFLVSSWATTAFVAYSNNHMPSNDDPLTLFDKIYDKPWTRLGPYLIGMMVGWILFKCNCKLKMNKITVCIGWFLSIGGMLSLVYGLYEQNLDRVTSAAYSSLSHTAWALCLAWVVVACSTGYGGIVNTILSSSFLYPFSRVTYCAYLVHPLVIRHMIITSDSPLHLSTQFMMITYLGVVSMSYGISFVVSLMFEAPVVSLLRLLSPSKSKNSIS